MKKVLSCLMAICCTIAFFTACDDDNNSESGAPFLELNTSYSGENLDLKYSNSPMLGKAVSFETTDGKTATITLKGTLDISGLLTKATAGLSFAPGVVPGEVTTTLTNVPLTQSGNKYLFEGTDNANGRALTYSGEVEKDKLSMSANVAMPANNLSGTWLLTAKQLLGITWIAEKKIIVDLSWFMPGLPSTVMEMNMKDIMPLVGALVTPMITEALQHITFQADGNITASYRNEATGGEWVESPLNLATYYIKDDLLYVQLNISMIMAVVEANKSETKADSSSPSLTGALLSLLPLLSEGIPLNYVAETGQTTISVNQDLLLPILYLLTNETISELVIGSLIPEETQAMLGPILEQLPGILATTSEIEISLNLEK